MWKYHTHVKQLYTTHKMHLSLFVIAGLVACIESSKLQIIDNNGKITDFVAGNAFCDNKNVNPDDLFKIDREITTANPAATAATWRMCLGKGSFSDSSWQNHKSDLFTKFHKSSLNPLRYFLSGSTAAQAQFWNTAANVEAMKKRVGHLKAEDLNQMRAGHKTICKDLKFIMGYMGNFNNLKNVNQECFKELLAGLTGITSSGPTDTFPITLLHNMNDDIIKDNLSSIMEYLGSDIDNKMKLLNDDFVSRLLRSPEACNKLTVDLFRDIIRNPKRADALDSACFEKMPQQAVLAANSSYGKNVKNIPASFFHKIHTVTSLDSDFSEFATEHQLTAWGNENDSQDENKCSNLQLNLLKDRIKHVDSPCFLSSFKILNDRIHIGQNWKHVKDDIFTKFEEGDLKTFWEKIRDDDLKHIKDPHFRALVVSATCELVKVAAINDKRSVERECFEKMKPEVQSAILSKSKSLPDDLLINIELNHVSNWNVYDPSGKKSHYGINFIAAMSNNLKLVTRISEAVESNESHVCSGLRVGDYEKFSQNIKNALSSRCLNLIKTEHTSLNKLPKKLWGSLSIERMTEAIGKDWSKAKVEDIQALIETHNFCNQASAEIINQLPEGAIVHIDADCLNDMMEKNGIVSGVIQKIPPVSFHKLKKDNYAIFKDKITPDQFGQLGDSIEDSTQSAISEVTGEDLTAERAGKVSPSFMSHLSSGVYGSLTIAQVQAIPAASWTKVTKTLASSMPLPSLKSMSHDQIAKFGLDVKNKDESPIALFTEEVMKTLSEEQKKAVEERKKAEAAAAAAAAATTETTGTEEPFSFLGMSSTVLILVIVGVVVVAAIGGYIIYRYNQ